MVAAVVALAAIPAVAAADFEPVVSSEFNGFATSRYVIPVMDSLNGVTVFNVTDQTKRLYHLEVLVDGKTTPLPVAPSARRPFDVDLGIDEGGRLVAAYSRCERRGPSSIRLHAQVHATPYPAWTTDRGCDVFRYDFATSRESRVEGASTDQASEVLPSIWRDEIAFVRVYEKRADRRGIYPYIYVRGFGKDATSRRQPGGARGDAGLPGPTRLDLTGRRLGFVWNYATQLFNGVRNPAGVTEVRLDTVGGGHQIIDRRSFHGLSKYTTFLSPRTSRGKLYYGDARVRIPSEGPAPASARLVRFDIESGERSTAPAPRLMIDTATDDGVTWAGATSDIFGASQPADILRNAGVAWSK